MTAPPRVCVAMLLVLLLGGCINAEQPPEGAHGESSSSPAAEATAPPTDHQGSAPVQPLPERDADQQAVRPLYLTDCTIEYSAIPGDMETARQALPDGWTPGTASGDVGMYAGTWFACGGSSPNNTTFAGPSNIFLASVMVEPPPEFDHGGGADSYVFWAIADQDASALAEWGAPVEVGEFSERLSGIGREARGENVSANYAMAPIDSTSGPNASIEHFHFQTGNGIRSVRMETVQREGTNHGGTTTLVGPPWGELHGPAISTQYRGTAQLALLAPSTEAPS